MEHIFRLSLGPSRAACVIFKVVVFFCVLRPALWKDSVLWGSIRLSKAFAPAFYLQEYPFSKTWDHPLSEYSGVRPGRISLTPNVYKFVTQVPSHERVFSVSSVCFPSSLHSQGLYAFSWASPILTRLDPHTSHSVSSSGSLCSWLKAIKTHALLQWPTTGSTKDIEKYTKSRERFKNTSQHGNQLALAMGQNTRSISFLRQVEAACPPVWRLVWSYDLMYSVALYKRMAPWKQSTRYARSTACLVLWFLISPVSYKSYICAAWIGSWILRTSPARSALVKGIVMLKSIFAPWLFVNTFPFAVWRIWGLDFLAVF